MTITKKFEIAVNTSRFDVTVDENMPLLWVLRDELGLVGTKYSCGAGLCGACSVLIDGVAMRSCQIRIQDVKGEITTIEGLGSTEEPHTLMQVWIKHQVAQCGYCQPGQIIATCSLLARNSAPDDTEIKKSMAGNLCRCGTYERIAKAIKSVGDTSNNLQKLEEKE